jgi:hypothetical protein
MTSYRVQRRAFLASLGGAFGLQALLSGMEASAQGTPGPPRLLVVHWPLGTVQQRFLPTATGDNDGFTTSPILQPFDTFGLHDDMIVLFGLRHDMQGMGGGNEDGTVFAVTGANSPGTRMNGGEADDGVAGGPSFDQMFLKRVPALQRPLGFVNASSDARVWSYEISTRCLSYGNQTQPVMSARPGGLIDEHVPLRGELKPLNLYNQLFSSMVPGGDPDAALRALMLRKSVLDSVLPELARIRTLAPAAEREKLDLHADAIRKLEAQLQAQIDDGGAGSCAPPATPDAALAGLIKENGPIRMGAVAGPEDATHVAAVGMAHAAVIRAAFQCDLIRVATLQWVPSTNQVAIAGMNPEMPDAVYEIGSVHYAVSTSSFYAGPPPSSNRWVYDTMSNIYTWFSRLTAEVVSELKGATDIYGGSVLDSTIVPYITDEADPADRRFPLPAVILGGKALGLQGGKFMNFASAVRSHNDVWMTVAQALMQTNDPVALLADEKFVKTSTAPIPGLWVPPA